MPRLPCSMAAKHEMHQGAWPRLCPALSKSLPGHGCISFLVQRYLRHPRLADVLETVHETSQVLHSMGPYSHYRRMSATRVSRRLTVIVISADLAQERVSSSRSEKRKSRSPRHERNGLTIPSGNARDFCCQQALPLMIVSPSISLMMTSVPRPN